MVEQLCKNLVMVLTNLDQTQGILSKPDCFGKVDMILKLVVEVIHYQNTYMYIHLF